MSDNKVNGTEYSFPNQEDKEKYSMSPIGGTESVKSLLKNKKLMKSFGMVVAFYVILQAITYFNTPKESGSEVKQMQVEQIKEAPVVEQLEPKKTDVEIDTSVIESNNQQIEKLSADISGQELSLNRLNSAIRDIDSAQQEIAYKLNQLEKSYKDSIQYIMEYINHQKDIEKQKLKAAKLKAAAAKPAKKLDVYFIRATIDGRAWLVKKGTQHNITVKVGDSVPTYGVVLAIDQDNAVINTSSGRKINLSEKDN